MPGRVSAARGLGIKSQGKSACDGAWWLWGGQVGVEVTILGGRRG